MVDDELDRMINTIIQSYMNLTQKEESWKKLMTIKEYAEFRKIALKELRHTRFEATVNEENAFMPPEERADPYPSQTKAEKKEDIEIPVEKEMLPLTPNNGKDRKEPVNTVSESAISREQRELAILMSIKED